MTQIAGITDFLDKAGTPFRVFDMGRRIQAISRETFLAFEQGERPYPYPLQQQAWLGVMVWDEKNLSDLVIWFIRFPLDARGCLTQGIRDDFVYCRSRFCIYCLSSLLLFLMQQQGQAKKKG